MSAMSAMGAMGVRGGRDASAGGVAVCLAPGGVAARVARGGVAARVRAVRVRLAGACALMLVLGSVVVVARAWASGPPEGFPGYYSCIKAEKAGKAYTGQYTERVCETRAQPAGTGKYELQQAGSGTFEAAGRSATLLAYSSKGVFESVLCKHSISTGELLDDVHATGRITLERCVANEQKKTDPCGNVGLEAIQTRPLFTTLVWLNKSESEPGILLEGEAGQLASFKCGTEQVTLKGYLIGAIENTSKGHTITYATNASKQQAHRSIWVFGAEIRPLNMYTQAAGSETEATLQTSQTQKGTGAY
jgi:hypothetical protein